MLKGKLIIIPSLGHQNKGKSSFTGSGLFVLMSQGGIVYHVIASCKRPIVNSMDAPSLPPQITTNGSSIFGCCSSVEVVNSCTSSP